MPDPNEILREAGKIYAGRRRITQRACERCGKSFQGIATARWCSNACKVAGYRKRRQERLIRAENRP